MSPFAVPVIEAVVFDYGGVICPGQRPGPLRRLQELTGLSGPALRESYFRHRDAYDGDAIDGGGYWRRVLASAAVAVDDGLLAQLIHQDTLSWSEVDARVLAWAARLRAAGLITGILSNMPRDELDWFESQWPWLGCFTPRLFSCRVGCIKPGPQIYGHLLRLLPCPPERILFLDDRLANVQAARAQGIQAQLFNSYEAVRDSWSWNVPGPA